MLTSCMSSSDAVGSQVLAKGCHLSQVVVHACMNGPLDLGHWMSLLWAVCPWVSLHSEQTALLLSHGAAQPSHRTLPQSHWSHSMRLVPLNGSHAVQWAQHSQDGNQKLK
uniref:Uncharacterized protein n=1 Tax=Eutreptiella gymnastica TaxID=73025 RepID=A0A7S1I8X7_9EUGL